MGKITDVIILKGGLQYQEDKTSIVVKQPCSELKLDTSIRSC